MFAFFKMSWVTSTKQEDSITNNNTMALLLYTSSPAAMQYLVPKTGYKYKVAMQN